MNRYVKVIATLSLFLTLTEAFAVNPVFCWLMDLQGCPGVEVEQGRARGFNNTGGKGIGATGAKSDRVETRTIIKVPDYKIRSIMRFFGIGGNRINISYSGEGVGGCYGQDDTLPTPENPLFESANVTKCFEALENDLKELPIGLNLQVLQCQEHFCHEEFIKKFGLFLNDNSQYQIRNIERFLGCRSATYEI